MNPAACCQASLGRTPNSQPPVWKCSSKVSSTSWSNLPWRRRTCTRASAQAWIWSTEAGAKLPDDISPEAPLRVLVAGGGLGGLFAAICLRKAGADVVVIERTLRYRPFGGPIQLASNGVSTIKSTSDNLFRRVHEVGRPFWAHYQWYSRWAEGKLDV